MVELYKEGLNKPVSKGGWGIKKFNLDDLYVRFFRLAERRIVEGKPGIGVVSFISNFSYLGDPSFVVNRKSIIFVSSFTKTLPKPTQKDTLHNFIFGIDKRFIFYIINRRTLTKLSFPRRWWMEKNRHIHYDIEERI